MENEQDRKINTLDLTVQQNYTQPNSLFTKKCYSQVKNLKKH